MSYKSILRELKAMKDGIGSATGQVIEQKHLCSRTKSHTASEPVEQGQWADLLPELLTDIIRRVDKSETDWPARITLVFCASVCRSWRDITKKIVRTPEECERLTFPISLKQLGPRDATIKCFIKRHRETSTYRLYFGPTPSQDKTDKFLLAAKKMSRATSNDFVISLAADNFSQARDRCVGKLRSNFLRTKFTIYDRQYLNDSRRSHANHVATISYEVNPPGKRGPRKMHCTMLSVPISSIPTSSSKEKEPTTQEVSTSSLLPTPNRRAALVVKNKAPRWHVEQSCWCLDFKGRVTEKSIKNFQLLATGQQEKVILQFGRIGRDMFVMDYCYPLSAFQAFGICLSSFDANLACVG